MRTRLKQTAALFAILALVVGVLAISEALKIKQAGELCRINFRECRFVGYELALDSFRFSAVTKDNGEPYELLVNRDATDEGVGREIEKPLATWAQWWALKKKDLVVDAAITAAILFVISLVLLARRGGRK